MLRRITVYWKSDSSPVFSCAIRFKTAKLCSTSCCYHLLFYRKCLYSHNHAAYTHSGDGFVSVTLALIFKDKDSSVVSTAYILAWLSFFAFTLVTKTSDLIYTVDVAMGMLFFLTLGFLCLDLRSSQSRYSINISSLTS